MKNVGEGRGEQEERAEGWWWWWSCVCCKLRNKFLSRVRTQPRTLFVRSSLQNMDEEELPELVVVCARPVLLVTMHLALCLQMPGMMVGMHQMDGKIWQHHTQQSTASPCRVLDWQIDSSLLIQWIVMHGRSTLMESFVWLLPRLCVQRKRERETRGKEETRNKNVKEREIPPDSGLTCRHFVFLFLPL